MNKRMRKLRVEIAHPMFPTVLQRTVAVSQDFALDLPWIVEQAQEAIRFEARDHFLFVEAYTGSWFEFQGRLVGKDVGSFKTLDGELQVSVVEDFSEIWINPLDEMQPGCTLKQTEQHQQ